MNVTLRQLRAFEAVARLGSFTAAAATLHITQSALSGLIKELEDSLGVRVLNRSSRRVEVSEIGLQFLPLTARVLQDLDQALVAITDVKALRSGVVRVSAPHLMACTFMPPAMSEFSQRHPAVELHVAEGTAESVVVKLRSGEVDLGVGPQREPMADIEALPLFELPYVTVFPPDHAFARRRKLAWSDLAGERLISVGGDYARSLHAHLRAAGSDTELRPSTEVAHMVTAISLVSAGLGITTCQSYAMPLVRKHGLRTLEIGSPKVVQRFDLFVRRDRELSPAARAFADVLRQHGSRAGKPQA